MKAIWLQPNGVTLIDLSGRIALGEGTVELRGMLKTLLEHGYSRIVLNLADVTYMDSAGTGELIHAHRRALDRGGEIKLAHVSEKIQGLLQLTKLYTVFDVFDDKVEAVAAFGRGEVSDILTAA